MVLLLYLLDESILRLEFGDLLPARRIDSVLGLHKVLPHIDLLLELFVHIVASLFVPIV